MGDEITISEENEEFFTKLMSIKTEDASFGLDENDDYLTINDALDEVRAKIDSFNDDYNNVKNLLPDLNHKQWHEEIEEFGAF